MFRGSLKGQRSHVGCHAPAGNVHGAKFCFPHELTEDSRNLRTNDGVRRSTFTEGAIMERAEYHRHSRARMAETAKDASRHSAPDAPERIDHRRRCTRHDHRTCCCGSRGSASLSRHTLRKRVENGPRRTAPTAHFERNDVTIICETVHQGFFAEILSIRPRSGSNPRPLCLTDVYFGQQWLLINLISDNDCGSWDKWTSVSKIAGFSTPNKMPAIRPSGQGCRQILGERTIYETGFYLFRSTGSPQSDDGTGASTPGAQP